MLARPYSRLALTPADVQQLALEQQNNAVQQLQQNSVSQARQARFHRDTAGPLHSLHLLGPSWVGGWGESSLPTRSRWRLPPRPLPPVATLAAHPPHPRARRAPPIPQFDKSSVAARIGLKQ